MVVTQVTTVFELSKTHPEQSADSLQRHAQRVGMAHVGSVITTLFLVYAGVSLPLLILFMGEHGALIRALTYEPIADEIVRTLVSTIGLVLAMPVSTAMTVWWLKRKTVK